MLLLLYIRADAVRQPIYGLLFGNFVIVALIMVMRQHDIVAPIPGQLPDFPFLNQMAAS